MSVIVAFGNRLRKAGAQLSFGFEEAKHPRYPRGHPQGGQLMPTGGGTERKIASPRTTDGEAAPEGLDLPSEEELAALAEPAQSKARDLVEQVRLEKLLAKLKEQGKISKAVVAFARPVNPFVPLRKAAPGQLALNWEEAAHPRGAGGRFTTKLGGGVRQSAPGRLQLQWGKPVGLGQLNWAFEAEELEESPLTAKVKKIASTLPIMEPQALWAFTDEQIAELRREAERNGDEVGMMMVDIHRNVRRDMSPGERADAAAVVKAMLKEYVAGRVSKAVGQLVLFEESEHPRHPTGSSKGGQFAPKAQSRRQTEGLREEIAEQQRRKEARSKPGTAPAWAREAAGALDKARSRFSEVLEKHDATKSELEQAVEAIKELSWPLAHRIREGIEALRPVPKGKRYTKKRRRRGVPYTTPFGTVDFYESRQPSANQVAEWDVLARPLRQVDAIEGLLRNRLRRNKYLPERLDPAKAWQWGPDDWPGGSADEWREAVIDAYNNWETSDTYVSPEAEEVINAFKKRINEELMAQSQSRETKKAVVRFGSWAEKAVAAFDASKHPRWPKGHPKGGQFRPSGVSRQKPVRPRTRIHFDVAVRERGHKIALGVNPEVVWSMFAEKAYGSPRIVAQMAVREALQNSRDACEAVGGGEIAFGYDATRQQAWFEDTGVGMDADTLEHKFLCLGETGKAHEVGAVGGFGVAKAVILSLSDPQKGGTWSIHTRDLALASHELEKVTGFRVVPERQGTAIRWDHISAAAAPGLRKGLRYMQCSDVGRGITMRAEISDDWHGNYNGEVSGLSTTRRKPLAETTFNDGETTLRLYKVDIDKENERRRERGEPEIEWEQGWENLVIRLGGLAQVVEGTRARGFYVVDVETTARPGSETYPFDPHRTGLKLDVGKSWLRDQLEQLTVEEKTGATIEGEAEACPVLLRQSDLSPDNARKIHALVQELGKLTDELHEYREARRKTGPQPPEALQDMSFARAELGLGETWGPRPPDDTVALDATAGRFLGPETPAGESRSIGIHQLAGLLIGQWYMTAVANHLAGRHLDPVPVDAIPGDVPAVASMTHAGMRGESVGLNVSYVSEAMISPDALDNFLFAEAVHEFAHLLEDSHDTDFAAAESQIHRGLWTVRRRLASDTRRLWKAYRAAGEATATRARAAEVPAPQGQLQLLKAVGAEDLAPLAALVEEGSRQLGEREALAMADTARVLVATVRRGVYWPEERALDLAAAWARELARDLPLVDRMGRPWVRRLYEAVLPLLMPAPPAALVRFGD